MSGDIEIRVEGRAGCMTLNRPDALNALKAHMSLAAEAALDDWRDDDSVQVVILDARGEKAFCAGGDVAELYERGRVGDFGFGRDFWRQEYRLNLKLATYPKPVVSFLQGFVMGGGVGFGCHGGHRIVGESSKIAMPECGIGLIPDVGGSHLLGQAPGHAGVYLGLTGTRMNAADAIYIGFADRFVPEARWEDLKAALIADGDVAAIEKVALAPEGGVIEAQAGEIDDIFGQATLSAIAGALADADDTPLVLSARKMMAKGAPLSLACALATIRAARDMTLPEALAQEYRFTYRSVDKGDFLEGIRAQIVDRDFAPKWSHAGYDVPVAEVEAMLAPLGQNEWDETGEAS